MKKQVLVSVESGETRVAILESKGAARQQPTGRSPQRSNAGWRVAELYIERPDTRTIVGNIYKGRVDNVLPGLEAAFVDIGLDKNGFLHVDDIVAEKQPSRGRERRKIADMIKKGQEIVVQAVKDPLRTKGPRVTMELAVPGRYMVCLPHGEGIGVSRRLPDKERERLRKIASKLKIEKGGAIVRTAAQGATKKELEREVGYLLRLQQVLAERTGSIPAPNLVFQEADLPIRVIRDLFSKEFERAVVDDEQQRQRIINFFKRTAPELAGSVEQYKGKLPLFEKLGVEKELRSTLSRRVDLPSGGYLVIDYTEAMTVVDVNTGSFTGKRRGSLEHTITKTNMEAADEVVRQLRLRDIGGIIVIDFIDMERVRNRTQVLAALNMSLELDSTKTYVMEISPLGLVEMTRQNVTDGVREIMTEQCVACHGEGVVLSQQSIALDVIRKLREHVQASGAEAFLVQLNPRIARAVKGNGDGFLDQLEGETGRHFHIEALEAMPAQELTVVAEGTSDEIEARALPFKKGEEVMVKIEGPHTESAENGAATVGDYPIIVKGAASQAGSMVLVRIDEVARESAQASLVGQGEGGDRLESEKKRGRRRLHRGR